MSDVRCQRSEEAIPDCPECGCNLVHVRRKGVWFRQPELLLQCDACAHEWTAAGGTWGEQDPPAETGYGVIYHVIRCPSCNSDDTVVTSTQRPRRYHRCRACGCNFKSVEQGRGREL